MHLERLVRRPAQPFSSRSFTSGVARRGEQRREPVEPGEISFETAPGLIWPGQRTIAGTRNAPSQLESFSLRNGVMAASGQENMFGPLSVV